MSNHSALTGGSVTSSTASASIENRHRLAVAHAPSTHHRLDRLLAVASTGSIDCPLSSGLVHPVWTPVAGTRVSASGSQRGAHLRLQHTDTPAHTNLFEKDGSFLSPGPLVCWCVGIPQLVVDAIGRPKCWASGRVRPARGRPPASATGSVHRACTRCASHYHMPI